MQKEEEDEEDCKVSVTPMRVMLRNFQGQFFDCMLNLLMTQNWNYTVKNLMGRLVVDNRNGLNWIHNRIVCIMM